MSGIRLGKVKHFFDKIGVAALDLTDTIRVGDTVHVLGHSTDFQQEVASLQIEHQPVNEAGPGQDVAMKVAHRVHPGDAVFKIAGEG
ncbi:MAG: translation elongation factor-like protein [Chloroflexi bacterium]|nr:translation elongation factor-like protein [Chloroflexota bacterium]MBI3761880.1 translation elongation factor-like protein [Chloroflexota bacterium]